MLVNLVNTEAYPLTVVYKDVYNRVKYARKASDWHRSMIAADKAVVTVTDSTIEEREKLRK